MGAAGCLAALLLVAGASAQLRHLLQPGEALLPFFPVHVRIPCYVMPAWKGVRRDAKQDTVAACRRQLRGHRAGDDGPRQVSLPTCKGCALSP
jgi:hypothetical protein